LETDTKEIGFVRLETDVLIVGAGPAGLTAALALTTYGIKTTVITKHGWLSQTPRAHVTNQRSFEVLRALGVEEEARVYATEYSQMPDVSYCASVAGEEYARWRAFGTGPGRFGDYEAASPCRHADLAQNLLEPILLRNSLARGANVRFNTEYVELAQDADSVWTKLLDRTTGQKFEVASKFLIGADGGNSAVAKDVSLPFEGQERIGHSVNILFEGDLSRFVEHRPAFLYMLLSKPKDANDLGLSVLRPTRRWTEWLLSASYSMVAGKIDLTEKEAVTVIRDRLGVVDLPVNVKAIDPWDIHALYATRYSNGRVFCAGDAVHRHSPGNGLGSNTAIQDSYNLAWKLALVLKGKAKLSLLDTYDQERVPIGRQVVDRATKTLAISGPIIQALFTPQGDAARVSQILADDADMQQRELHEAVAGDRYNMNSHGVEMNQRYRSSAIIPDGNAAPASSRDEELYYTPSTVPGAHLPHAWIQRAGRQLSTLDLVGKNRFVLLTGSGGEAWLEAAQSASAAFQISVDCYTIGRDAELSDYYGDWERLREIDSSGCILVRPDGYICFRERKSTKDASAKLSNVFSEMLGTEPKK
jgi:2,4-dichlorophenol 6-monooxygenase